MFLTFKDSRIFRSEGMVQTENAKVPYEVYKTRKFVWLRIQNAPFSFSCHLKLFITANTDMRYLGSQKRAQYLMDKLCERGSWLNKAVDFISNMPQLRFKWLITVFWPIEWTAWFFFASICKGGFYTWGTRKSGYFFDGIWKKCIHFGGFQK